MSPTLASITMGMPRIADGARLTQRLPVQSPGNRPGQELQGNDPGQHELASGTQGHGLVFDQGLAVELRSHPAAVDDAPLVSDPLNFQVPPADVQALIVGVRHANHQVVAFARRMRRACAVAGRR